MVHRLSLTKRMENCSVYRGKTSSNIEKLGFFLPLFLLWGITGKIGHSMLLRPQKNDINISNERFERI